MAEPERVDNRTPGESAPPSLSTPIPDAPAPGAEGASSRGVNRSLLWGCAAAVAIAALLVVGGLIGFTLGRVTSSAPARVVPGKASAEDMQARAQLADKFGTFWDAMDLLYANYYGTLPAGSDGVYAAIKGVVAGLDDPHTSFYTPDEAKVFREALSGTFEGIGAQVEWDDVADTVRVVEPYENQPAWSAGIRRGDWITAVDGVSVVGTDLNSAIERIRGPKGTSVHLALLREDETGKQPFEVDVIRDTIETPTVVTEFVGPENEIAHIRLYMFSENAGDLLRDAVEAARQKGSKGIILDLRGNSGGLLREAVKVSSVFMDDATVLLERFKDGREEVYRTTGRPVDVETPLVLLVNEGSASASEIVAGALQDAGRAELVGTKTFGKGSVQLPESLDDGSILRVTIARWFTPANRTIDGVGLAPDVEVALSDDDREAGRDPQLDKALEEMARMLAGAPDAEPTTQP